MVDATRTLAVALWIALAGCSANGTDRTEQDPACSAGDVVIQACECPDSPLVGSRRCVDGDWELCQCPDPSDAAAGDAEASGSCAMAGVDTECWRALVACFPAADSNVKQHVETVCAALCSEEPVPGTSLSCDSECGDVAIDLGLCAQDCSVIASSAPATLEELCPG